LSAELTKNALLQNVFFLAILSTGIYININLRYIETWPITIILYKHCHVCHVDSTWNLFKNPQCVWLQRLAGREEIVVQDHPLVVVSTAVVTLEKLCPS